jgi:hypothetical protein
MKREKYLGLMEAINDVLEAGPTTRPMSVPSKR